MRGIGCPANVPTNPSEYYDHVAFSEERRNKNKYTSFDVNTFVKCVVEHMKAKHKEYEKARFKSFTRFEEKCDFIDNVVFPAMRACSDKKTDANVKKMVDAFEKGVRRFTTFGNMSGIAKIFESAYFAMTTMTQIMVRDDYGAMVKEYVATVSAKSANFEMSDETKCVVCDDQPKEITNGAKQFYANEPVMGVTVADQQNRNKEVVTAVAVNHVGFFDKMRSVRVPQHRIGEAIGEATDQDDVKNRVMERTSCNA